MIKWWQWILIIITAGVVFYACYPKYDFGLNGLVVLNKITGRVKSSEVKQTRETQKLPTKEESLWFHERLNDKGGKQ